MSNKEDMQILSSGIIRRIIMFFDKLATSFISSRE